MSSDSEDDDLFGGGDESDDTADLIAASKKTTAAAASKKPAAKKKAAASKKPSAAAKKKDDSDSSDGGGLFDSDSDDDSDDDDSPAKKPKAKEAVAAPAKKKAPLSKRERLEALARRKKAPGSADAASKSKQQAEAAASGITGGDDAANKEKGYDSGDSYDSADFQRTADDDAFIDTTGEDADAVNELYAEQNFDDERPDDEEGGKKKKGKKRRHRADEAMEDRGADGEPDNPVMAAVHRMKKKKRAKKSGEEIEDEVKVFLHHMDEAAEQDEQAVKERRPATKKLQMLNQVCDLLTRRDMQRILLDFDLLTVVKRWVQPLPNGTLGNVTVRQRVLESVAKMTGENGVTANHLKRSGLGKTVMILCKHRSETPAMKRQLKELVEQWSRPIFQKSGNMRDLGRVQRGSEGLAALSRQQHTVARQQERSKQQTASEQKHQDLNSLIASGKKGGAESLSGSANRVRVPFSKGFAYSVQPAPRAPEGTSASPERRSAPAGAKDTRDKLSKRMTEKGRTAGKNQRSANLSIEGRATKG